MTTSESEDEVKSRLLLDVVVRQCSAVFELLAGEDESLLVWWNAFLVLDLGLDVFNGVRWLDLESDSLASESLYKDLHAASQSEDEVESRLLLDVVVRQCSSVFELLAGEDESLLVWWNAFLVLDLGLDVLDGVRWLDFESDSLASESLYKDLHAASQSEDEVESRLLLDVVVRQCSAVFELLASEDESLLVWRNAFLVLDLGLDVLDGVRWLDLESDGLAGESLYEDLHAASQSEDEVKSRLLLDVVVRQCSAVLELLSGEDESLLVWWNAFLVLDLGLDILDGVRWLDLESDGLASESLYEDLHSGGYFVCLLLWLCFELIYDYTKIYCLYS